MRFKRTKLALVIVLAISMSACLHKAGPTPPTAWEKVTAENAILAQLIDTTTQGVIAVHQGGLLPTSNAHDVLQFLAMAASDQKQITAVLAKAPDANSIPGLIVLVDQIKLSGQSLVASGGLGVKNPQSQQTIAADLSAIVDAAELILKNYQLAIPTTVSGATR